jgi:hypothetical protein
MSEAPERIWYNGTTLHARELRWRPPESDAHPQIEYVSADAMKAQIDAAVKAERDRCAKVAEACPDSHWGPWVARVIRKGRADAS